MVKRYNQFIKEQAELAGNPTPVETPVETPMPTRPSVIPTERPSVDPAPLAYGDVDSVETESEEEGIPSFEEDVVEGGLEGLADQLGADIENNTINFDGHEIDQPSETGNFRVDGIDLKTADTQVVIDYLNNPEAQAEAQAKKEKRVQAQAQRAQAKAQVEPEVTVESKSYKTTRNFKSFKRK